MKNDRDMFYSDYGGYINPQMPINPYYNNMPNGYVPYSNYNKELNAEINDRILEIERKLKKIETRLNILENKPANSDMYLI